MKFVQSPMLILATDFNLITLEFTLLSMPTTCLPTEHSTIVCLLLGQKTHLVDVSNFHSACSQWEQVSPFLVDRCIFVGIHLLVCNHVTG